MGDFGGRQRSGHPVIVTGADGHAVLQVSDGSTIEVCPNSRFVFRKNPVIGRLDRRIPREKCVHIEHLGTVPIEP
jgi:hypothetical protein